MDEIEATVKRFIMEEFLPDEDPAELTDTTPLVTGAILDSVSLTRLVVFLDETFGIQLKPHEVSSDRMNTLAGIAQLVRSKQAEQKS